MKNLDKIYENKEFMNIVNDILYNDKFQKIKLCKHHGQTRLEHSLRVAYYSFLISKKMKLDYRSVARAGLLHDFFLEEDLSIQKRKYSLFFHPYKSLENANNYFFLNNMEKDIILTHMFPSLPHKVPKYLESWLVSFVDKVIAVYEFYYSYGVPYLYKLSNLYLIMLLLRR